MDGLSPELNSKVDDINEYAYTYLDNSNGEATLDGDYTVEDLKIIIEALEYLQSNNS